MKTLENNKLAAIFDLESARKTISVCPKDEIVILLPHYSINKPEYSEEERINGTEFDDMDELGDYLNVFLQVNDYDDLICDPHGILE